MPVILFLGGFLRWYWAIPAILICLVSLWSVVRTRAQEQPRYAVSVRPLSLLLLFLAIMVWTQLGGMNGLLFQTQDWHERNAVFRDLITHRWPVVYENGTALVYYVGHWLPPALIGKLAKALFHSESVTWAIGRMALWVWSSIGLTILVLCLFAYSSANSPAKRVGVFLLFVFFSGMDILGAVRTGKLDYLLTPDVLHLEWWMPNGNQYTSITACIYWVFNQSIIPWIATICFLMDQDERHYMLYAVSCLVCGPLPLVGLAILMVGRAAGRFFHCLRTGEGGQWLRSVFSVSNVLLLLCVPCIAAYLLCSRAIGATESSALVQEGTSLFSRRYWNRELLRFFSLEVGIYILLIWNDHKKDFLLYVVAASLMLIPYFHVGLSTDFCMRASIPAILVTLAYSAKYLNTHLQARTGERLKGKEGRRRICALLLALALLIGAATPCLEIYRGLYHVVTEGSIHLGKDALTTLGNYPHLVNFLTSDMEHQLFYRYLARESAP
ncbi:MAG: hypothetical protein Q4C10_05620 [Clostridia bacterium]|nr:hypothetical protein [Clostridia bacterium]